MVRLSSWMLGGALLWAAASAQAATFDLNEAARLAGALQGTAPATSAATANMSKEDAATLSTANTTLGLVTALSGLNLTPQQMLGGAGALFSVAQHQMPQNQYSALLQAAPALAKLTGVGALEQVGQLGQLSQLAGLAGGLLGQPQQQPATPSNAILGALGAVKTMQDANGAFSALGMSSGVATQMAPLLLQYFLGQSVPAPLVQALAAAWGASMPQR
ncbi:MAG: DUF2780 domain-containing protein [Pseudomonas sp.]